MNVFRLPLEILLVSRVATKDKERQDYKPCVILLQAVCNPVTSGL